MRSREGVVELGRIQRDGQEHVYRFFIDDDGSARFTETIYRPTESDFTSVPKVNGVSIPRDYISKAIQILEESQAVPQK